MDIETQAQAQAEMNMLSQALDSAWDRDEKWAIREQRQALRELAKRNGWRLSN